MKETFISHSPEETRAFGQQLAITFRPGLVTLQGELGAGKTKLSAGILEGLGAEGPYQSPTFMLMKEYHLDNASVTGISRVYHVDAYRLEENDFENLGLQEWLEDKEALTLLEWPERVQNLLPEKKTAVTLEQRGESEREITVERK